MWIKQVFNAKWVDMVHQVASSYKDQPGNYETHYGGDPSKNQLQHDNYLQRIIPVVNQQQLGDHITRVVFDANKEMYAYDIWYKIDHLQYTTYQGSVGAEFPWHTDSFLFGKPSVQKLSVVVGLTDKDEYEGGMLEIMNRTPIQIKLGAGEVVVFPSVLNHRVTPVTRGVRKTLVTWYTGPMWR